MIKRTEEKSEMTATLLAIRSLTDCDSFVLITSHHQKGLAITYSDELSDSIIMLETGLNLQKKFKND
jgi:hypothetical protein